MITVGKRIRQLENRWSDTGTAAETIGVSRTAVSRWESGEIDPTIEHLIELTQVLKVSADYLLGTDNTNQTMEVLINMASTRNKIVSEMQSEQRGRKEPDGNRYD